MKRILLLLIALFVETAAAGVPRIREYFIAAEEVEWDYAPTGRDEVCGTPLPVEGMRGRKTKKLRYVRYADASFRTACPAPPSLGILGPVLRGVVGDTLQVTFLNRSDRPLSIHPHGVHYDKASEGSNYQPSPGAGAAVAPRERFTYTWFLDAASGPLPGEPGCKAWLYHSHVKGDDEINLGLVGCILVADPARARADATPTDVDREFATLFMIFDETPPLAGPDDADPGARWAREQAQREEGQQFALNGRIYGNLHGLEANEGERVRWYLFGLGSEEDFHTAHWHGVRAIEDGRRRTDVVELLPGSMKVVDLVADNPGTWLFHCHVAEHMRRGMFTRFTIHPKTVVGADIAPAARYLGLVSPGETMP